MSRSCWLVLGGLLSTAVPANAGPLVPWNFRAVANPPSEPRVLFAELVRTEGTYSTPSGYFETIGMIDWRTESGHPRSDESGVVSHTEVITAVITLTDLQSGQSVELPLWVTAWSHWEQEPDGGWDWISSGESWGPYPPFHQEWFTLGLNQYKYWNESGSLVLGVNAGPNVPEPGTLVLAGLGLTFCGVWLRKCSGSALSLAK